MAGCNYIYIDDRFLCHAQKTYLCRKSEEVESSTSEGSRNSQRLEINVIGLQS